MAFAGGWLAGLLVIGSVVMFVGDVSELLGGPSMLALAAKLVLGAVLVIWALAKWRKQSTSSGADRDAALDELADRPLRLLAPSW